MSIPAADIESCGTRLSRELTGGMRSGKIGTALAFAVIAVTPETEEVPKSLKTWSGRPDSNRRRPAWEAGILPLNYSRACLQSISTAQIRAAERRAASSHP